MIAIVGIALIILPTALIHGRTKALKSLPLGDRLCRSLLITLAFYSSAALLLAFANLFTLRGICFCGLVYMGVVLLLTRRPAHEKNKPTPSTSINRRHLLPLLLILPAVLFYGRPDDNIAGNWDPGVYMAQGASLARTGTLTPHDPASEFLTREDRRAIYPDRNRAHLKVPGFYLDEHSDSLKPQFYPLYSVWTGLLYLFGGLPLSRYLSGSCTGLSLWLMFLIGRNLAGVRGAWVTALIFLFNPVAIWFSGFHTSEVLMQTCFLAGTWCWISSEGQPSRPWFLLSSVFFSLCAFVSVTGIVLVGVVCFLHLFFTRRRAGALAFYFVPVLSIFLLVYQNLVITDLYFESIVTFKRVMRSALLNLAVVIVPLLILLVLSWRFPCPRNGLEIKSRTRILIIVAGIIAFAGTAFALYRPAFQPAELGVLATMMSRTGILAAVAGMVLLGLRYPNRAIFLVCILVLFTGVFYINRMMTIMYPWAFKRYLAVTLPLLCLFTGLFWAIWLGKCKQPWAVFGVILLAVSLAGRPFYRGINFAFVRDWPGLSAAVEDMANHIPQQGIIFAHPWIATPLEFLYGKTMAPFYFDQPARPVSTQRLDVITRLLQEKRSVYLLHSRRERAELPFQRDIIYELSLRSWVLNQARKPFGSNTRDKVITLSLEQLTLPGNSSHPDHDDEH